MKTVFSPQSSNRYEYLFDSVNENSFSRQEKTEYIFSFLFWALKLKNYSVIGSV